MLPESECRLRSERAVGLAMVLRWNGDHRGATIAELVSQMWAACAVARQFRKG